jgi:hypothetical protein
MGRPRKRNPPERDSEMAEVSQLGPIIALQAYCATTWIAVYSVCGSEDEQALRAEGKQAHTPC